MFQFSNPIGATAIRGKSTHLYPYGSNTFGDISFASDELGLCITTGATTCDAVSSGC